MNEWIKVEEQLPLEDEYVLWIFENGKVIHECTYDFDEEYMKFFLSGGGCKKYRGRITHWMRVPPLNKEGEE
jgi:hypothetical protein